HAFSYEPPTLESYEAKRRGTVPVPSSGLAALQIGVGVTLPLPTSTTSGVPETVGTRPSQAVLTVPASAATPPASTPTMPASAVVAPASAPGTPAAAVSTFSPLPQATATRTAAATRPCRIAHPQHGRYASGLAMPTGRQASDRLRSVLGVFLGDQPEDCGAVVRRQDPLPELRLLEQPRDAGQRLEVQPGGVVRREEHEEEVRRLGVDGGEVDP